MLIFQKTIQSKNVYQIRKKGIKKIKMKNQSKI